MMQIPSFDIYPYWEFIKRRKWWLIAPFLFVLIIGVTYIYITPKLYRATTLVMLENPSISEDYVGMLSDEPQANRLQVITRKINSRTNLKSLLNSYDLNIAHYQKRQNLLANLGEALSKLPFISEGEASSDISKGDKYNKRILEQLQKNIEVEFSSTDDRVFEISFLWHDPAVAAEFANEIAKQFIDQNSRSRELKASGATDFLSFEVGQLRNQLSVKENELERFRKKNIGMLPEQLEANIDIMNQKKDELDNLNERLELERQRAIMLSKGINRGSNINIDTSDNLTTLINELKAMKSRYTKKHPDVVALQSQINEMISQDQSSVASRTSQDTPDELSMYDESDFTYRAQLDQTRARIENYQKQIRKTQEELRIYQERVEQTPNVEMQLRDLQRDYETLNDRYQNILARKLDAQMAEELERRHKSEQFTVVDSAIPPLVPFQPDMRKMGLMTLLLGLGLGGGLAYLRESMDPAFFTAEDAESLLGQKVLVSLPWDNTKDS